MALHSHLVKFNRDYYASINRLGILKRLRALNFRVILEESTSKETHLKQFTCSRTTSRPSEMPKAGSKGNLRAFYDHIIATRAGVQA